MKGLFRMLTREDRLYFLAAVDAYYYAPEVAAANTQQSLELFENQLTLKKLKECLDYSNPEIFCKNLEKLLHDRWQIIRNSSMCYTQQPYNPLNLLCIELAHAIFQENPYKILMPSLENFEDVYGENIHSLKLHEMVLSDNERVAIPLAECLHQASISDEGELRHLVSINGEYPQLTSSEIRHIVTHSKQAAEYYQAVMALNKERLHGKTICAQLTQLANALRKGSYRGSGEELNAGAEANQGILIFYQYWMALPEQKRTEILTKAPHPEDGPTLREIIDRLFRPKDANYQQTKYCVALLANSLDSIIEYFSVNTTSLQVAVSAKQTAFIAALKKNTLVMNPSARARSRPPHVLPLIFRLDLAKQEKIFIHANEKDALMYTLVNEPEELSTFNFSPLEDKLQILTPKDKRQAISMRTTKESFKQPALNIAAEKGATSAIECLLDWGADIEARNMTGLTALHTAARFGQHIAVAKLLDRGASLEARSNINNTALNMAVGAGSETVVSLLLERNADLNAKNDEGMNALDLAIVNHPELVKPLLKKLETLPLDRQAACLSDRVFDYFFENDADFINNLLFTQLNKLATSEGKEINSILTKMHFDEYISLMIEQYNDLIGAQKAHTSYSRLESAAVYQAAATSMRGMLKEYMKAKIALYTEDGGNVKQRIATFQQTCKQAAETARLILSTHRNVWGVVMRFLLAIIFLPFSVALFGVSIFSTKTRSEQLINRFQKKIDQPKFGKNGERC